jgi:hypothetical protein
MKRMNLFFYYQWIYRRIKNYRRKIHRRSIFVGDSIGKLITDGICVLRRRKNSVGKTVKSCSDSRLSLNLPRIIFCFDLFIIIVVVTLFFLIVLI